ncbi:DUF1659 domain-containing protein [Virgibacillus salexigens]|uniref:DUF1659 domain-containing protein n=2 Tax=Virgibacillus TaxID=84406 RepID=A0A024Q7Y1_9BACI|nr:MULTISPECIES: DUF1659 domain-containing protein [Virgibacillus]MYL40815.1 DUF1659 domain-containing protein [Virgibacillus massiliensis]GGJ52023.1 hypothetical protein GCM10007111_12700 [Virgibacillus kapii]CDQ38387.1 hypothetical protein BN990_00657 [Virgibacillus massiliensis]
MASSQLTNSSLWLVFDNGINESTGKMVTKTKSFNNVKTAATAEQLYIIAEAFTNLQQLPLEVVERKDTSEILAE